MFCSVFFKVYIVLCSILKYLQRRTTYHFAGQAECYERTHTTKDLLIGVYVLLSHYNFIDQPLAFSKEHFGELMYSN